MKRLLAVMLALFLLTGLSAAFAESTAVPTTPPNEAGMPYLLEDYDEASVLLSQWKGTPLFVNFFTSWCGYCKQEMPDLKKLQEMYGENLRVVMVHVPDGEDEQAGRDFVASFGMEDMTFVEDNGFFAYMYGLTGYPTSVIIDADGYLSGYYPYGMDATTMRTAVETAGVALPEETADAD